MEPTLKANARTLIGKSTQRLRRAGILPAVLYGKGKTSLEIGKILELAERTVNFHLTNAMRKLRVHTRAQAVAKLYPLEGVAV